MIEVARKGGIVGCVTFWFVDNERVEQSVDAALKANFEGTYTSARRFFLIKNRKISNRSCDEFGG